MGVVNAGSSPAPALQDSLTGKTSAVLFLQILVVGLLNFWCGGVTAAPQPFTNECWQDYIEGNFIVLRARGFKSCQSLVVCLGECRQDYIGFRRFDPCPQLAAEILSLLSPAWRMPAGLQPFTLYVLPLLVAAFIIRRTNHGQFPYLFIQKNRYP